MAKKARPKFASDFRRYVRLITEGFADNTADLTDGEFRAFVLCLVHANEQRAQFYEDRIFIARSRIQTLAPNRRGSNATSARTLRGLCGKQTWGLLEGDAKWTIHIRNYSQIQEHAPDGLRDRYGSAPDNITITTPSSSAPPTVALPPSQRPETKGWLNFLTDGIPIGLRGETWETAAAWFDHHYEILDAEAEGNARTKAQKANGKGDSTGWEEQYNPAFKSILHRYWANKKPEIQRRGRSKQKPTTKQKQGDVWET